MWLKLLPLLFLMACASSKKAPMENEKIDISRLHDIWALQSINGEEIPEELSKTPVLEIFVETKKALGNDGCNSISGSIKKLTENELVFGLFMGTKMACPNMDFPKQYNSNLFRTRFYSLQKMELILLDINEKELLRYKKVD